MAYHKNILFPIECKFWCLQMAKITLFLLILKMGYSSIYKKKFFFDSEIDSDTLTIIHNGNMKTILRLNFLCIWREIEK